MNKASFWQRFAAWLIDQIILIIINFLLIAALTSAQTAFVVTTSNNTTKVPDTTLTALSTVLGVVLILLFLLAQFLYFGYLWSTRGRSIGMGLMNIRVVKIDESNLSFLIAGLRGTLGYYLSGLIFGLGYLWFFVDGQQATWHDKIFNTTVLEG